MLLLLGVKSIKRNTCKGHKQILVKGRGAYERDSNFRKWVKGLRGNMGGGGDHWILLYNSPFVKNVSDDQIL